MNANEAARECLEGKVAQTTGRRTVTKLRWDEEHSAFEVKIGNYDWELTKLPFYGLPQDYDGWEIVEEPPKEGSQEWAREQAREGKLLTQNPKAISFYGHDSGGFYYRYPGQSKGYINDLSNTEPIGENWQICALPPEQEHEVEKIGVKLLTKEGKSAHVRRLHMGGRPIFYPIGEWIEVEGDGAYMGVDAGIMSGTGSIRSGGATDGLIVAYFDCSKFLHNICSGVETYRWVRRLPEPCPEKMPPSFHKWVRSVKEYFSEEQLGDLLPKEEESEWVVERCPIVPEASGTIKHYIGFRYKERSYTPTAAPSIPGFWRFEFTLPSGEKDYSSIPTRLVFDEPQEIENRCLSVLDSGTHATQPTAVLFKTRREG